MFCLLQNEIINDSYASIYGCYFFDEIDFNFRSVTISYLDLFNREQNRFHDFFKTDFDFICCTLTFFLSVKIENSQSPEIAMVYFLNAVWSGILPIPLRKLSFLRGYRSVQVCGCTYLCPSIAYRW